MITPPTTFESLDQRLGITAVWRRGYQGSGVAVAVADPGITPDSDLAGIIVDERDFTGEDDPQDRADEAQHGTQIARIGGDSPMTDTRLSEAQCASGHGRRGQKGPGRHRGSGQPRPAAYRYLAWVCCTVGLLAGCDAMPRDSAGALNRVRGGTLRAGVVDNPPWVRFEDGRVTGLEPALLEAWAQGLNARVTWRRGAESELVEALHRREVDVLAAGFDSTTPHKSKLGLTQPYVKVEDRYGARKKHVLAVTQGESALLFSLDRFLAAQDKAELRRRVQQTQQERAQP